MNPRAAESRQAPLPPALEDATRDQPRVRMELSAALATGPTHAYLFRGPSGTGKRTAARGFAAELLAAGAPDPDDARRRALVDPPAHPDLVWLRPQGAQHLVEEVRELVIRGAAYRPVEGERRVFVIEAAEAMGDESQNALLKTLEEPATFAHLVLVSSAPELLLETIASRCRPVDFEPLAPDAVEARLPAGAPEKERRAAARLSGGDVARAARLLSEEGRSLRAEAERCARAAVAGHLFDAPWSTLLERAERAGAEAGAAIEAQLERTLGDASARGRETGRLRRQAAEEARRASRRAGTAALDLGLELCGAWFRDLIAVAEGAPDVVLNADRLDELRADADGLAPARARQAAELVLDARRRLDLNVSAELALEALFYRLEEVLT